MHSSIRAFAALTFLLLASLQPGFAQSNTGSSFYSIAKVPLPEDTFLKVESQGNSDLDQRLRENLVQELQIMGFRIRDNADMVLSYRSSPTHGIGGVDPSIGSLNASSSRGVEMNVRLWSSNQSDLASGRKSDIGQARPGYRLQAEIRQGATVYWVFDAINRSPDADAYTTLDEILPLLAEKIGQTEGTPGLLQ